VLAQLSSATLRNIACYLIHTSLFAATTFVAAIVLCAHCSAESPMTSQPQESRPNIVLFFADDLGVHDLGCYGREEHKTPRLDRLAQEGIRFTCTYTAQPICSPSRAGLMTGLYPARLQLTNFLNGRADANSQKMLQPIIQGQLPLEEVTIAELLKQSGYRTGLFGKWHLGNGRFGPQAQGFDVVVTPKANTTPSTTEGGKGEYEITAAVEKFIEENRSSPFFCYIPHNTPHIPLAAKEELVEKYKDTFHPTYAAMMETMDDSVGRVLDKLESLGLSENTIVIFTSDNGGLHVLEFPGTPATHCGPYRAGKGYLYEGGLREPLIVRWPSKIKPAQVNDTPVSLLDLAPTLLSAAGLDPAKVTGPLDGVNMLPLLTGEKAQQDRTFYWHFPNYTNQGGRPASALRQGKWKLVEQLEDNSLELYDLESDIGETRNISAENAEITQKLAAELTRWRKQVGGQALQPNPNFDSSLHQALYVDKDPSKWAAKSTAAASAEGWQDWRKSMNQAVAGKKPLVTPAEGEIRLQASEARVHGTRLRYEPEPYKNVLGYWTEVGDWADWDLTIAEAGQYEIEVQQGCGSGGGSEVDIRVGDKTVSFVVQDTGHFQKMILITLDVGELPAGQTTLEIRPKSKKGVAIMDIRRIVVRKKVNRET
jgi:arylsulfatase A